MLKLYRIKFFSPATPIRAYTIFGTICWAYRLLGLDIDELFGKFKDENPPFLISSPFPIVEVNTAHGKKEIPLLPKPVLPIANGFIREDNICLKVLRKPIKKAKYITPEAFSEFVNNKQLEERVFYEPKFCIPEDGKADFISLNKEQIEKVLSKTKADISVRNMLNRETMKSEQLFTEESYYFADMYFLIKYIDESMIEKVEVCLKMVEDNGLGANKNIGWGRVSINEETSSFKDFVEFVKSRLKLKSDNFYMTLSPVLPQKEFMDLKESFYKVEPYKAPTDTTFGGNFIWKKKVLYLSEGSAIKPSKKEFVGHLKNVGSKEVKAYQYGFEFPLSLED